MTHQGPNSPAANAAQRFASALNAEDYALAATLLHPGCVYTLQGARVGGPEAVLASYRGNGDAAAETFDAIAYGSEVRDDGPACAVIRFWDRITHRGERFVHMCEQRVRVDADGKIERIEHRDLPGEQERLAAFRARHGL